MKKRILFLSFVFMILPIASIPSINSHANALSVLQKNGLWHAGQQLRLHVGCGQCKLPGYVNIDFPSSEHTVQNTIGADAFGDIANIAFLHHSVDEVRSHHVFEHFTRDRALALLCGWHHWLKIGGRLVIETPYFEENIKELLATNLSFVQKQAVLRHLTGSHEASWAIHCDGWYAEKFVHVLQTLGFKVERVAREVYKNLHNITVIATKSEDYTINELYLKAREILKESLVDYSESELRMLDTWYASFVKTFNDMTTIL